MKYRIPVREEKSRAEKRKTALKWFVLILCLIMFYVLMRAGIFDAWMPVFIIPLAAAVSMFESEFSSSIFALLSGYLIDIASGFAFGFSVVWLMPICLTASLLVRNLIRTNLFNYCIVCLLAVLTEYSMDYLFNVVIWSVPGGEYILINSIIPTAAATFVSAPAVYYLVRFIEDSFGTEETVIDYVDDTTGEEKDEEGDDAFL